MIMAQRLILGTGNYLGGSGLLRTSQLVQNGKMAYFILEATLFAIGAIIFLIGKLPVTRRRMVSGSPTRVIGFILMIPLGIYLVACRQSHVSPLGWESISRTDPLMPMTGGFVRLAALAGAFGCVL